MRLLIRYFSIFSLLFFFLGYLSYYSWILELFSNFRMYFLFVFLITVFGLLYCKEKILLLITLFSIIMIIIEIQPYLSFGKSKVEDEGIKVISANILSQNKNYEEVIDWLNNENADIIFLMEITPDWERALNVLRSTYPHHISVPRLDNFGIALFSKVPLDEPRIIEHTFQKIPFVISHLKFEEKAYTFIGAHPEPPIGVNSFKERNQQLEQLNQVMRIYDKPLIICGDFNCSSFSQNLKRLTQGTTLKDSRIGQGLQATWSAHLPIFNFAIDHCFVSENINVLHRRKGPANGSDHYPIIIQLQ